MTDARGDPVELFLVHLARHSEAHRLSIAWCSEFGMPEVAGKMVRDLGGLHEFSHAMKRRAARELSELTGARESAA